MRPPKRPLRTFTVATGVAALAVLGLLAWCGTHQSPRPHPAPVATVTASPRPSPSANPQAVVTPSPSISPSPVEPSSGPGKG
jgi:hypothetical protein